tara:strand:- start:13299 stop:17933 length:4635 start_codon:yes stop_codon:yes gene_type:complete
MPSQHLDDVTQPPTGQRPRVLFYVRTNDREGLNAAIALVADPRLDARAIVIADKHEVPASAIEGIRWETATDAPRSVQFLDSLTHQQPPFSVEMADIVCRLDYGSDTLGTIDRKVLNKHASAFLEPERFLAAVGAFVGNPQLGMAFPAGLPRQTLGRLVDASLAGKLAQVLALPKEAVAEANYFAHTIALVRSSLVKSIHERYLGSAAPFAGKKTPEALEIGLTAVCAAFGLEVADLTPGPRPLRTETLATYARQLLQQPLSDTRSPHWRPLSRRDDLPPEPPVKFLAYYLPQFHAIPENDQWWGKGFTEWTNVSKAVPRFIGHHQPRLPHELGHYDLNTPGIMRRQIELARTHGIAGFCFYYYWFNGRTLLEAPLRQFLADSTLEMPFCLCWANENWTRRWDGQEQEVLIAQSHSPRDDIAFLRHIQPYLADPRYIRVDGKPMLLVYRASLLDDAKATAMRWRKEAKALGIGDLYLVAVCSFDIDDPRPFGFDAAAGFPPHQLRNMPPINGELDMVDPGFSGEILDYRDTVLATSLAEFGDDRPRPFAYFPGVMTGWDNDARRPGRGRIFHHATPARYAKWLRLAANQALRHNPPGLRYVFVNAWNEWAEGAHLEPDRHFGYGYLAATADTLRTLATSESTLPPQLGSASAALRYLPEGLVQPRNHAEIELIRTALAGLTKPRIQVVLWSESLDSDTLDTLQTLAEQCLQPDAVTLVCVDAIPTHWIDGPKVEQRTPTRWDNDLRRIAAETDADWILPLVAGDRLFPHTLLTLALALAQRPKASILSCDALVHTGDETRSAVRLWPTPTLETLRCRVDQPDVLAVKTTLLAHVPSDTPSHSFLPALRLVAIEMGAEHMAHVQEVLLWCDRSRHPATRGNADMLAAAHRDAVDAHFARRAMTTTLIPLTVIPGLQVHYPPAENVRVSVIIPTRDQPDILKRCVESVFENTAWPHFELIIVDDGGDDPAARALIEGLEAIDPARFRTVRVEGAFNFAALCNAGARVATGDMLLFLNDDTAALHRDWLEIMLGLASHPDIGAVGARLVFPDGRLQHAGVMLGLSGAADMHDTGASMEHEGWNGNLQHTQEVGALTAACMLVPRAAFNAIGGFDEAYDLGYADFDLCQRLRVSGYRLLWTPHATLMHDAGHTLKARFTTAEASQWAAARFTAARQRFLQRWHDAIVTDPASHPALSLASRHLQIESRGALAPDPLFALGLTNVLALPADAAGSGHYRVVQPALAAHAKTLVRARVAAGYPTPAEIARLGIDTLHTQRQVDDAQLSALAELRSTLPLRVVMDFDDLLMELPSSNIHARNVWPDISRRVREACRLSDTVTVSTPALADAFRGLHDDVRCVPNVLDPALWLPRAASERIRGDRLRVGWAGGVSHAGDLALIRDVVAATADKVDWVFFGMCLEDIKPHLAEFHAGVKFADYPASLAALDLDLAVAPLALNRFNECKSNLRLLEYGAVGVPVLATDIVPYQCGLPVTLLPNTASRWVTAIVERTGERETLEREGNALRAAVMQAWSSPGQLPKWVESWAVPA